MNTWCPCLHPREPWDHRPEPLGSNALQCWNSNPGLHYINTPELRLQPLWLFAWITRISDQLWVPSNCALRKEMAAHPLGVTEPRESPDLNSLLHAPWDLHPLSVYCKYGPAWRLSCDSVPVPGSYLRLFLYLCLYLWQSLWVYLLSMCLSLWAYLCVQSVCLSFLNTAKNTWGRNDILYRNL